MDLLEIKYFVFCAYVIFYLVAFKRLIRFCRHKNKLVRFILLYLGALASGLPLLLLQNIDNPTGLFSLIVQFVCGVLCIYFLYTATRLPAENQNQS